MNPRVKLIAAALLGSGMIAAGGSLAFAHPASMPATPPVTTSQNLVLPPQTGSSVVAPESGSTAPDPAGPNVQQGTGRQSQTGPDNEAPTPETGGSSSADPAGGPNVQQQGNH